MRRLYLPCIALSAAIVFFHLAPSSSAHKPDKLRHSQRAIQNHYIVVLDDETQDLSGNGASNAVNELNTKYPGHVDKVYSSAVKGYSVEMSPEAAEVLSQDPRVKYVEEDGIVSDAETEYNPAWALDRIDQHAMPYDNAYNYFGKGSGVHVYILDSGIQTTHVEFQGRAVDSYDAVHDSTPISQCNGHGTGVAGVVGSATYGVAKNVTLHSVRVLPCTGYGTVSDVISGVDWITRHAVKPAVANMSLETGYSSAVNDAVAASIASGVTYVVASGNDTDDACRYSPSSVPQAITVGATNNVDAPVYYSNFGACVDLHAPGEGVKTIWNGSDTTVTYASGTSFASPFVAGAAALYLEIHPKASPAEVQSAIVANATADVLYNVGSGSPNLLLYSTLETAGGSLCSGTTFGGTLAGPGSSDFQSSSLGFSGATGQYSGNLQIPDGTTFTLSLEKKARSKWSTVATSSASAAGQSVIYNGRSGTYRWTISSVSGSGAYSLCAANP